MADDGSAFAALGLDPDADDAEIERAYKRLIKEHHPDREGGDARRAAEINRAYRELRAERGLKTALEISEAGSSDQRPGWRGWTLLLAFVSACAVLVLMFVPIFPGSVLLRSPALDRLTMTQSRSKVMERPLYLTAINAAARSAQHLARTKDEIALATASRDCHHQLRSAPSLLQLDRCAAFDDAVVQLQDRDPLRDQGPFGELAVTGRLWSGATALSDDYVAIDGRLDRIRLQVAIALAPLPGEATGTN